MRECAVTDFETDRAGKENVCTRLLNVRKIRLKNLQIYVKNS